MPPESPRLVSKRVREETNSQELLQVSLRQISGHSSFNCPQVRPPPYHNAGPTPTVKLGARDSHFSWVLQQRLARRLCSLWVSASRIPGPHSRMSAGSPHTRLPPAPSPAHLLPQARPPSAPGAGRPQQRHARRPRPSHRGSPRRKCAPRSRPARRGQHGQRGHPLSWATRGHQLLLPGISGPPPRLFYAKLPRGSIYKGANTAFSYCLYCRLPE